MFFKDFINQKRKELGMSVDELSKRSGVSKGTLSKLCAGINTNPTIATAEAILRGLGCSFGDMVSSDGLSPAEREIVETYRRLDPVSQKAVTDLVRTEALRLSAPPKWAVPEMGELKAAARSSDGIYRLKEQPEADQLAGFQDITDNSEL
ncbi:MAG: helix-turn-helix transcriptional regulator [Ruminococcus sp.]|nr:helix-turn-helix transcriptional regulator [Ruminococcus sp.]